MSARETFETILTAEYRVLFASDPEYAYVAGRTTPEALAVKITAALATGGADISGRGVVLTCKALGVKRTKTAIRAYLAPEPMAVMS